MREAVGKARDLFLEGLPLVGMVDRRLALDLDLFSRGGLRVLDKIERRDYNVLAARPGDFQSRARALAVGIARRGWHSRGRHDERDRRNLTRIAAAWRAAAPRISTTRSSCSPAQQRKAMCAIYAFMRHCGRSERRARRLARRARRLARRAGSRARRPLQRAPASGRPSITPSGASAFRTSTSAK